MIDTIYFEEELEERSRTRSIFDRFPSARRIPCTHYGEIFNRKSQNFRLQKHRPALIIAKKHGDLVLEAPAGYAIGGDQNYYFSHMLNCVYDCRYCFLQGMFRSAHYVLFINYEDFAREIKKTVSEAEGKQTWFFSGYDCDSLALDSVTRFVDFFVPIFDQIPHAWLELRTKSTRLNSLLNMEPADRCVVAFSLNPREIAESLEHKAPTLSQRLNAIERLQTRGWRIGLRFDPLIYTDDYVGHYAALFEETFSKIDVDRLHSVSLGTFRLPRSYFRNISRLYPEERLFASPLEETDGVISYHPRLRQRLEGFCTRTLLNYIPERLLFPCSTQSAP